MSGPATSFRTQALVFAALLALLAATVALDFVDLGGAFNQVGALTIATLKASLVVVFFMHARTARPVNWILFLAGIAWWLLLVGLTMADVATRKLPEAVH